jgi:hypothetical protein
MVGVAFAGYTFLGSSSSVAVGGHLRPADVAMDISTAATREYPTPENAMPSISTSRTGRFTPSDLAAMQTDMDAIARQVDALMQQTGPQGSVASGDRLQTSRLPRASSGASVGSASTTLGEQALASSGGYE